MRGYCTRGGSQAPATAALSRRVGFMLARAGGGVSGLGGPFRARLGLRGSQVVFPPGLSGGQGESCPRGGQGDVALNVLPGGPGHRVGQRRRALGLFHTPRPTCDPLPESVNSLLDPLVLILMESPLIMHMEAPAGCIGQSNGQCAPPSKVGAMWRHRAIRPSCCL